MYHSMLLLGCLFTSIVSLHTDGIFLSVGELSLHGDCFLILQVWFLWYLAMEEVTPNSTTKVLFVFMSVHKEPYRIQQTLYLCWW